MNAPYRPDARVRGLLDQLGADPDGDLVSLSDLKKEILRYGKRRCDVEASRDNLKYYLGFAFEVNKALDIDSLALTGVLSMPSSVLLEMIGHDGAQTATVADLLRTAVARPKVCEWAVAKGTWLQWKRLESIYRAEIEDFIESDAFNRPGWRRKAITRNQHYLLGEIRRILGCKIPPLTSRGQAFNYIAAKGGNPRFLVEPPLPTNWWDG